MCIFQTWNLVSLDLGMQNCCKIYTRCLLRAFAWGIWLGNIFFCFILLWALLELKLNQTFLKTLKCFSNFCLFSSCLCTWLLARAESSTESLSKEVCFDSMLLAQAGSSQSLKALRVLDLAWLKPRCTNPKGIIRSCFSFWSCLDHAELAAWRTSPITGVSRKGGSTRNP